MRLHAATCLLWVGVEGIAEAATVTRFPYNTEGALSPDKQFVILNIDHEGRELAHSLELKAVKSGLSRKLLDYGRHVEVSWSPHSNVSYVNDYSESDVATCLLVVPTNREVFDLSPSIKVLEEESGGRWGNHHRIVTCKSWGRGKVSVSFAGYGDLNPGGFEQRYTFDMKSRKLRRTRN